MLSRRRIGLRHDQASEIFSDRDARASGQRTKTHPKPTARTNRNTPAAMTTAPMPRATRSPPGARRSAVMAAVTTVIAVRFITPITSRIAVRPAEEQLQCTPKRRPCRQAAMAFAGMLRPHFGTSRQQVRCCAFHTVNCIAPAITTTTPAAIGMARANVGCSIANAASAALSGKISAPNTLHMKK